MSHGTIEIPHGPSPRERARKRIAELRAKADVLAKDAAFQRQQTGGEAASARSLALAAHLRIDALEIAIREDIRA